MSRSFAPRIQASPKELQRLAEIKPVRQRKYVARFSRICPSCNETIQVGSWITKSHDDLIHELCAPPTPQFVLGRSLAEKRRATKQRYGKMRRVLATVIVDLKPKHQLVKYDDYMQSKDWVRRKSAWYTAHGKWCRGCEAVEEIHLHHQTYRRLGHEADEDLVALCATCHMYVHHLEKGEGKTLKEATEMVVLF